MKAEQKQKQICSWQLILINFIFFSFSISFSYSFFGFWDFNRFQSKFIGGFRLIFLGKIVKQNRKFWNFPTWKASENWAPAMSTLTKGP